MQCQEVTRGFMRGATGSISANPLRTFTIIYYMAFPDLVKIFKTKIDGNSHRDLKMSGRDTVVQVAITLRVECDSAVSRMPGPALMTRAITCSDH